MFWLNLLVGTAAVLGFAVVAFLFFVGARLWVRGDRRGWLLMAPTILTGVVFLGPDTVSMLADLGAYFLR